MSRKLIVINIGGSENIGEMPHKWPPDKGEFMFNAVMYVQREVMQTQAGMARTFFLHPVGDYRVRTYSGWRNPLEKERKAYVDEMEASKMVRTMPRFPPEIEDRLRNASPEEAQKIFEELKAASGAGPKPPESAIVAP